MRPSTMLASLAVAGAVAVAGAAPASASTFCVPNYHAACADNGTNVPVADLQDALTSHASDGVADRILIAAGSYADVDSFTTTGSDPLEVAGAGRAATQLTSLSSDDIPVLELTKSTRKVTLRDFTIVIPAGFDDFGGIGLAADRDTAERVDIVSRNPGATGAVFYAGGAFRNGRISATAGGGVAEGIIERSGVSGQLLIEDAELRDVLYGVRAFGPGPTVFVRRTRVTTAPDFGCAVIAFGGFAVVDDVVITVPSTGLGLCARGFVDKSASLAARHVTLVRPNEAPGPPAIDVEGEEQHDGTGTASLAVVDSIVRGFSTTYVREGQAGGGAANLLIAHSNSALSGINSGPGTLDVNHENFAADPHFAGPGDYHLLAASPSIDRADPDATAGATDLEGAPRLRDGNGDGIARRDQGAYEFQPPTSTNPATGDTPTDGAAAPAGNAPATPAQPAPDTTPPSLGSLHIRRLSARRGGRLRTTVSEAAQLRFTLKPMRRGRPVRRLRYSRPAGTVTLRIPRHTLQLGRYRLRLIAIDAAGNRSAALCTRVRVRR